MFQRFTKLIVTLGFVPALFISAAPMALADDVSTTGPNSSVTVTSNNSSTVTNNNNLSVTNTSTQTASSGSANVSNNTTGGNATSGNASNSNSTTTSLQITNLSSMPSNDTWSASTTGPNSPIHEYITNNTTVTNNNNVRVTNRNNQTASTGEAEVTDNTTGGNATSGNASNNNCTSTSISINNGPTASSHMPSACGNNEGGGQGGGSGSGSQTNSGGGQGQVLGASFTVASIAGGKGAAFATLPNTGVRDGINVWLLTSVLTIAASILYWSKVIAPRLKNI